MKMIQRVAVARAKKELGRYVRYGTAGIEEIDCKLCGRPIRKLVPHDNFHEQRDINGRQVLVEKLVLATLPLYVEVEINFDDGTRHVTNLCQLCAEHLTLDECEHIYCCDMNEWLLDNSFASDNFWSKQVSRHPASFRSFPPGTIAP